MNSADVLQLLWATALSSSVAMALILLLRGPVRRWLGASAAYLLWLALPVALLAPLLPAPSADVQVPAAALAGVVQVKALMAVPDTALAWPSLLFAVWLLGAVVHAFWLVWLQRRFTLQLGRLRARADGTWLAESSAGLPAAVGLLRSRIVLPVDFEQRYDAREQTLVLLHERVHQRRGDLLVNALLAALRCLYWFNPVLLLAVRCCREDQELSCDERVIAQGEGARRSYGNAMLKTTLASSSLPLGCHWQGHHPLKERIAMLKRPVPGRKQWVAMLALSAVVSSGLGYAAWAAQPAYEAVPVAKGTSGRISAEPEASDSGPTTDRMTPPVYPKAAVEQGISGKVVLRINVGADGKPTDVVVETAEPKGVFDEVAVAAAYKWNYTPARRDGKPVAGAIRVPIWFDMDENVTHTDEGSGG